VEARDYPLGGTKTQGLTRTDSSLCSSPLRGACGILRRALRGLFQHWLYAIGRD